ncbi:hypothetical protein T458_15435 [Brevibacillus panacihumi W25]|uniref:DUF3054 domain-containing protein n=1 Tax=Brevibacillus panacihumi W25 TaxID=1408254 RepID=V6M393_9BACL|nr:DUF3054 domain-containing protein [Brevibacillus panacihumi]EST52370.1 hypothetical protein T458_15435 [Brevibacillus panacihumi W25]
MGHRIMPAGYVLFAGDLVAFWLFVYIGKGIHQLPITFLGMLETLAPFLLAWLVASFLLKSYQNKRYVNAWSNLLFTFLTWTLAAPIGLLLRSWWTGVPLTWIFAEVTYLVTFLFLLGWRVPFAIVYAVRGRMQRIES